MRNNNLIRRIFPYLVIITACGYVFFIEFGNLDELWNYSFALNVRNGLLPYRDFNMIQTPLSAFIAGGFLVLFGEGLFSFRVLSWVLLCLIHLVMFRLYLMFSSSSAPSLLMSLFGILLLPHYYHYNSLVFLILMLVLYRESHRILVGGSTTQHVSALLIGLTPLIKQTTGIALLIVFFVVLAVEFRFRGISGKIFAVSIGCLVLPGFLFALWLAFSGTFYAFIDYALYGLRSFTHRTTLFQFASSSVGGLLLTLTVLIVLICAIYVMIKRLRSRQYLAFYLLMTAAGSIVAFPLCDTEHFGFVVLNILPLIFYMIDSKPLGRRDRILLNALSIAVLAFSLLFNNAVLSGECQISTLRHYEFIPIDKSMEHRIKTVDKYILLKKEEGKRVCIANSSAAAYLLPEDIYIKDYSMLLKGNLGTQTAEQLYKREKGAIMLVWYDDTALNRQDDVDLIQYIKENGVLDDKIEGFEAYKT